MEKKRKKRRLLKLILLLIILLLLLFAKPHTTNIVGSAPEPMPTELQQEESEEVVSTKSVVIKSRATLAKEFNLELPKPAHQPFHAEFSKGYQNPKTINFTTSQTTSQAADIGGFFLTICMLALALISGGTISQTY